MEIEGGNTWSPSMENTFGRFYGPVVRRTAEWCWSYLQNSYCGHVGTVDGREFETQSCRDIMRIKPTGAYENIWINCIIMFVNLLHVSVTFCVNFQGDFSYEGYFTKTTKPLARYTILSSKYVIHNIC